MNVTRYDRAVIKARRTDEGFLVDSPVVARAGVHEYINADGSIRREYRPDEEVFNAASLASYSGKPITDDHPGVKVTAKNAKLLTIGTVTAGARRDGDNVVTDIIIHDAEAIDKIDAGNKRELSVGYSVVLDESPGEHPVYGKYDAIQREIKVNHVALVKRGRAGNARLNLDGSDVVFNQEDEHMPENLGRLRLDGGLEYQAAPEVIVAFEKMRDDKKEVVEKLDATSAKIDALEAERDALKSEVAKIEQIKSDAKAEAVAEIKARAELESVAVGFKVDCKDKSDREIKESVIKSVRGDDDLSAKSDIYIDAAYDFAVEMKSDADGKSSAAMAAQRAAGNRGDSATPAKTGQERYKEFMKSLGKKD